MGSRLLSTLGICWDYLFNFFTLYKISHCHNQGKYIDSNLSSSLGLSEKSFLLAAFQGTEELPFLYEIAHPSGTHRHCREIQELFFSWVKTSFAYSYSSVRKIRFQNAHFFFRWNRCQQLLYEKAWISVTQYCSQAPNFQYFHHAA